MEIKVGDKVTFRCDLIGGKKYGDITMFRGEMLDVVKGKTFTVSYVDTDGYFKVEEGRGYYYSPEMLVQRKYKIGDRVRIVSKWESTRNVNHDGLMDKWLGKVMTVRKVEEKYRGVVYKMEEDKNEYEHDGWFWYPNMIAGLADDAKKIVITTDGKTTTAKLYEGNAFVKEAVAKCSPSDTFEFNVGATLALSRLIGLELKPEPKKPKFTKADLKTGMFVLVKDEWAVVANDILVYEKGEWDKVFSLSDDLCFTFRKVEAVVEATSFRNARLNLESDNHVLYRRSEK